MAKTHHAHDRQPPRRGPAWLVAAAVLLLTLTLRVPTTSVSPLVPAVADDTGYPATTLALLTTIPLLCFVVVAPVVPALLARLGMHQLLTSSLLGAALGTLVRSFPGAVPLAAGTLVLGCAVAVASVLAPAVVRAARLNGSRSLTALYTASLSLGPAMATGLTVPLGDLLGGGWRAALALWAVLPLLALVCWELSHPRTSNPVAQTSGGTVAAPRLRDIARERSAWSVTAYLGTTSLLFYTTIAWLPTVLEDGGTAPAAAGATTAIAGLLAVPSSLLAPLAARSPRASGVTSLLAPVPVAVGLGLLAAAPATATLATALLGVGQGASVGVAYTLVVSTSRSTAHATALSSMSQTTGVTLAAVGPVALAAVHETTGTWALGLTLLAAIALAQSGIAVAVRRSTRAPR